MAPEQPRSRAVKRARFDPKKNGAGNRIRTDDPRITNALLYQLSYPGVTLFYKGLEAVQLFAGHTRFPSETVKVVWLSDRLNTRTGAIEVFDHGAKAANHMIPKELKEEDA